jgi:hypothetical protein
MREIECPLCSKSFVDLLEHLVIVHDVLSAEHFVRLVAGVEADEAKRREFRDFATELYSRVTEGKITAEEYRRRVMNWSRDSR